MAAFEILAAIDLRAGRVVRLRQGDFERETAYGDDPVAMARDLVGQGIRWLHVVDLDGARAGERRQQRLMSEIVRSIGRSAAIELAGGFRSVDEIEAAVAEGAARVVVGSAALDGGDVVASLIERVGADRIAVAIDVRAGLAVGQGWDRDAAGKPVMDIAESVANAGVRWLEVTAIQRDGTLRGPDVELLSAVVGAAPGVSVIASGGIRSVEDLRAIGAAGSVGAIVGRAFYENSLTIAEALDAADELLSGSDGPKRAD